MTEFTNAARRDEPFADAIITELRAGMLMATMDPQSPQLTSALRELCTAACRNGVPAERVVLSLKRVWQTTPRPGLTGAMDWDSVYRMALKSALSLYFEQRPT